MLIFFGSRSNAWREEEAASPVCCYEKELAHFNFLISLIVLFLLRSISHNKMITSPRITHVHSKFIYNILLNCMYIYNKGEENPNQTKDDYVYYVYSSIGALLFYFI